MTINTATVRTAPRWITAVGVAALVGVFVTPVSIVLGLASLAGGAIARYRQHPTWRMLAVAGAVMVVSGAVTYGWFQVTNFTESGGSHQVYP